MKTIRKNELTRFFKIIVDNDLSSDKKIQVYLTDQQLKAHKIGVFTDEGIALRKENEIIFAGHNYLAGLVRDSAVSSLLYEYLNKFSSGRKE